MKKYFSPIYLIAFLLFIFACNNSNTAITDSAEVSAAPEVKSVFINDDSLHYIDIGKGEPVIFIHGAAGDYRGFSTQVDTFSKHYRVIVYSRRYAYPDHGLIKDSMNYSIDSHVKDLVAFIKALNLAPAHLVGHSFGANMSLQIAQDHPELVSSITLGEPAVASLILNVPGGDTVLKNFATKVKSPSVEAFKKGNENEALKVFVNGVMGDTTFFLNIPPIGLERIKDNLPELRAIAFTPNPFPTFSCEQVQKIKVPTLLVVGDLSPAMFKITADELERCLVNKDRAMLPNTSHALQDQNPAEFNKVVLRFIDKH